MINASSLYTGLQLIAATDDGAASCMRLFDLRSSKTTPLAEFLGHSNGIFAISWCPIDTDFIVSCGKDNRTLLWDLSTAQIVNEIR